MKTNVERMDENKVKLAVTVPAADVDAAIDEAYKRIAKKVKIPGFRAGKAPRPIIDSHVGRDGILADAQEELLGRSYSDAIDAEGLRPIAQPEIEELDLLEPGADFQYEAEVELRPELTLSSIDGLSVTVPSSKTTDREIDTQIDAQRERFATLETVEDRGIEADDYVLLSFVGDVGGEPYEGNVVDKYLYEMNRGMMPEEFDTGLMGLKAGDETTISFLIPESSTNPDFVGKTANFAVTVHEVKAKVLPEVDDEFAASVGGYDTLEQMRTQLRAGMERAKQASHVRAVEAAVRAALAERLEGAIPETMIESTKGQMTRDFINSLESRDMSFPDYLQATGVTPEQLEADIGRQAEVSIREELALEALFRHMKWEVTDEDIDAELMTLASDADPDLAALRAKWQEAGVMPVFIEQIMHRRAVEWLLDRANVTVIEEGDEAEPAPAAKKKAKRSAKKTDSADSDEE